MKNTRYQYDTALIVGDCGATTPTSYRIYIVPHGDKPIIGKIDVSSNSFAADHADGLSLRWTNPRRLEISYKEARIFRFENFWEDPNHFSSVVEIRLHPLKQDWSLSADDRNVWRGGHPSLSPPRSLK